MFVTLETYMVNTTVQKRCRKVLQQLHPKVTNRLASRRAVSWQTDEKVLWYTALKSFEYLRAATNILFETFVINKQRPSGQHFGLVIRRPRGSSPDLTTCWICWVVPSSTPRPMMLVNSQLVASCQLQFLSCYVLFGWFVHSNYLSEVPVN